MKKLIMVSIIAMAASGLALNARVEIECIAVVGR